MKAGDLFVVVELQRGITDVLPVQSIEVFSDRKEALKAAYDRVVEIYDGLGLSEEIHRRATEELEEKGYFSREYEDYLLAVQIVKANMIDIRLSSPGFKPQKGD